MNKAEIRPEWRGWALWLSIAGTIYLLATGLIILLAPFGAGAQISVLVHTGLGVLWLVPILIYMTTHFVRRFRDKLSHLLLLGYMAGTLMLLVLVSGVVLTVQAAFGRRISYAWDLVHIVTGCAVGAIVLVHMLTAVRKAQAGEGAFVGRLLAGTTVAGLLVTAATFFGGATVGTPGARQGLPEGYRFRYGENPFAPSLARTDWLWRVDQDRKWVEFLESSPDAAAVTEYLEIAERQHEADRLCRERGERHMDLFGGFDADARRIEALRAAKGDPGRLAGLVQQAKADLALTQKAFTEEAGLRPERMAGSRSCGTTDCHEEILGEWQPSAHRYSSRSAFFQAIQGLMAESNGAESTRYCAGCHDPISLFSGAKNIFHDDLKSPGADEGISCVVCHSIVRTDVQGNANYVVSPPTPYLAEDSFLGRFLIRAYPRHHKTTFGRPLLETPEFCGACHKQFIDKELNRATRVQLQNQYDAWKGSHWFVPDPDNPERADPEKSLACRDCHMRIVQSDDPGKTEGQHRHHGIVAANQWLPIYHKLPNAERHVKLVEDWLQGKTRVPEIEHLWPRGPVIPIEIQVPETVKPGATVKLKVVADNRKVGHTFPTGPLDVIQSWFEITVKHGDEVVFHSGGLDADGFIEPGTWMLKAEGVDRGGNVIDRHNLWDMVGARFRRVLYPGYSDQQDYEFVWNCESGTGIRNTNAEFPAPAQGELVVTAVLHYRKVDQTLLNVLQPDGKARAPVTDMSTATARIRIEPEQR